MNLLFKGLFEFIIRQLTIKILLMVVIPLCIIALFLFGRSNQDGIRSALTQVDQTDSNTNSQDVQQQVVIVDDNGTILNTQSEDSSLADGASDKQSNTDNTQTFSGSVLAPQTNVEVNPELVVAPSQGDNASSALEPQVTLIDRAASTEQNAQVELNRIVIPAIDLDVPVTELGWHSATNESDQIFSEWDVAINAAGWHKNSARPGEGGNVVMSGHNNIYGAVFRELDQLDQGDEAFVYVGDRLYTYEIEQVIVVPEVYADAEQRADNAQWIEQFDDDRMTLVSCWPRDDNSHRIIVIGYAVEG